MACWKGMMTQSVRRPKQQAADKMEEIVNIGTEGIGILDRGLKGINSTLEKQADINSTLAEALRKAKPRAKGKTTQAPWKEAMQLTKEEMKMILEKRYRETKWV